MALDRGDELGFVGGVHLETAFASESVLHAATVRSGCKIWESSG